jgi:heterodisulfide reductase subunit D
MNKEIKIRTMAEMIAAGETPEILFWVGCSGSFDDRAKKITKAIVRILDHVGIKFAILGSEEGCTGDPAKRAGNEFLYQMQAMSNITTMNMYNVKKIVTGCPHCFNTLKNEYPELGGQYEVVHYSEFLSNLIKEGKLKISENAKESIAYHDSCYLGRINGVYEAPREILTSLQKDLIEMKRSKEKGLCCGAGGAQMFKEDEPGDKRVNVERIEEVLATGTKKVVANCPFCITMLEDGLKAKDAQDQVMVYDLAELILQQNTTKP